MVHQLAPLKLPAIMSGIEVLGVVAGGAGVASLAIQLGDCAVKLRKIYKTARNAPRQMEKLASTLDIMKSLLDTLKGYKNADSEDELLSNCIRECREDVSEVESVIANIERSMMRDKELGGEPYAALKQQDITDLMNNVERSKSALALAHQLYVA